MCGPVNATPAQVLDAVASAHVVFELCQSRIAEPAERPRHVMLADCIANAGWWWGRGDNRDWRSQNLSERPGRLLVDGTGPYRGQERRPVSRRCRCWNRCSRRAAGIIAAGQVVITGSLIGMNWLSGRHDLEGIVDGFGEVAIKLVAA